MSPERVREAAQRVVNSDEFRRLVHDICRDFHNGDLLEDHVRGMFRRAVRNSGPLTEDST